MGERKMSIEKEIERAVKRTIALDKDTPYKSAAEQEISVSLSKENIIYNVDYVAFRYVDDIFLFANQPQVLEQILSKYKMIGERYLLRLNELKLTKGSSHKIK